MKPLSAKDRVFVLTGRRNQRRKWACPHFAAPTALARPPGAGRRHSRGVSAPTLNGVAVLLGAPQAARYGDLPIPHILPWPNWSRHLGDRFFLCTQNVDSLHEQAGSQRIVHMHGRLMQTRCSRDRLPHQTLR